MSDKVNTGFMVFDDQRRLISRMTLEQRGMLFTALFAHSAGEEVSIDDPLVEVVFWTMSESADRVREFSEKQKANRTKRNQIEPKSTNAEPNGTKPNQNTTNAEPNGTKPNQNTTNAEPKPTYESEYEYESEDIKKTTSSSSSAAAGDAPPIAPCPQSKILELYHNTLPTLPKMKVWQGSARENNLRARWRERWEAGSYRTLQDGIDYWQRLFGYVRQCPFLMGEVEQHGRDSPFVADLAWIVKRENFIKIIEGKYERRTA